MAARSTRRSKIRDMSTIDPQQLKRLLGELASRFDVDVLDECDSTNSEVMRRAEAGAASGLVVVAERQLAGRGRRGRTWSSSPESSLTFSLLWRFSGDPGKLSGLSLAVGVALADALNQLGIRGVALKWPNDLLMPLESEWGKLGGILIELFNDRRSMMVVIGIGLNLAQPSGNLGYPVADLASCSSAKLDRVEVLAQSLRCLASVLARFASAGFEPMKNDWNRLNAWAGDLVTVSGEGLAAVVGHCRGVNDQGALLLETPTGIETVFSGDVSLRKA